jgi:hypothetical protein
MTNINLSQSTQVSTDLERKTAPLDKGVYISIAILAVTLLIYGGLYFWDKTYKDQKAELDSQIVTEARSLEGQDVNRVADFQLRMQKIGTSIAAEKDPIELLRQVGQVMIGGSVVNSLDYSAGSLKLKITADNFQNTAKQVLSFKKSSSFSDVQISDISKDSSGKIIFTLGAGY